MIITFKMSSKIDLKLIRFYQLQKQNLLTKANSRQFNNLLTEHIALHSTDYLTPYLSLHARIKNFEPELLFNELKQAGEAIRIRAFREMAFVNHRGKIDIGQLRAAGWVNSEIVGRWQMNGTNKKLRR